MGQHGATWANMGRYGRVLTGVSTHGIKWAAALPDLWRAWIASRGQDSAHSTCSVNTVE